MRGGAIPILAWGTILLVYAVINWAWDDKTTNGLAASAAVVIIYGFGVLVWLVRRRDALRRGPPEPDADAEVIPQASVSAMLMGLGAGCALFGLAWAKFLLYFGIAIFVLAVGRLILELRAERMTRRDAAGRAERR